ncbi:hypothetical protein M0R45_009349 [Rubus argutus]|uniref:Uncharacterized protein n=1 Tax=Rubus argutus TaxID=59490 RepID=A0AAW1Y5T5_RUBAR
MSSSKIAGVRERRAVKEKSDQDCESKEEPKAAAEVASSTLVVIKGEGCRVCGDDDRHIFGCPYEDYVPLGATVCPGYFVICRLCGRDLEQPVGACWMCGKRGGRAMAKACCNCHTSFDHMTGDCPLWKGDRNPANVPEYIADPVMYAEEPVMAEYIEG